MTERYIVQRPLSDGQPGYWSNQEWWADRDKAKVYKLRARAAQVAIEYGGEVVTLTSKTANKTVYAYDLLEVLKTLRERVKAESDWNNEEYKVYQRGMRYAYGEAAKMITELLEEQGVDIDAELAFLY